MAAKRMFRSSLDWSKFADALPKDPVNESAYKSLKSASESWTAKVGSLPEALPEIDWSFYKTRLPAMTTMVSDFEQKYKPLKIDYPKQPTDIFATIDKLEKENQSSIQAMKVDFNEKQVSIKHELSRLATMPPMDQMTIEDWLHYWPEYTYDPRVRPCWVMPFEDLLDQPHEWLKGHRNYGLPIPAHH